MIDKYIALNRALRNVGAAAREAADAEMLDSDGVAHGVALAFLVRAVFDLRHLWPNDLNSSRLNELIEQAGSSDRLMHQNISILLLPQIEDQIDAYFASQPLGDISNTILDLLHPRVIAGAYAHFRSGRHRDAVLNAFIAVFDLIRERTGIDKDGADLVAEAFSLQHPKLVFSDLATESGKNMQKGYIQLLQGAFLGIRNPNAHSLQLETDQKSCAQYLVFASLLCTQVEQCSAV